MEQNKRSLTETVVFASINFCKRVWAFEKALVKKILSKREANMAHRVEFAFGKVDPWIISKSNSAKEISLAELEEMV